MSLIPRAAVVLFGCCLAGAQAPAPQLRATPEDLAAGERTYRTQCASCHGPSGEGGRGATLARPRLLRAPDDRAMFGVIQNGIPDTEMPGHWYPDREIWQLVAFVRRLGRVAPRKIDGDPARGAALYAGKGACFRCHTVNGRGGALGPDLTDIGARRSVDYLRQALLDPEAAVPDGFLEVELATRDGRRITGVRLNQDAFSIQIRELSDNFESFLVSELSELKKLPGKSPMPSYKVTFTPGELDDLIAYLDSLRGSP